MNKTHEEIIQNTYTTLQKTSTKFLGKNLRLPHLQVQGPRAAYNRRGHVAGQNLKGAPPSCQMPTSFFFWGGGGCPRIGVVCFFEERLGVHQVDLVFDLLEVAYKEGITVYSESS